MRDLSAVLRRMARAPETAEEREDFARCEQGRARVTALTGASDRVLDDGTVLSRGEHAARMSSSPAKARLLYRLVRQLQPAKVVELGSAYGVSGAYTASALRRNGRGELVTIEFDQGRHEEATRTIEEAAPGVTTTVQGRFEDHFGHFDGVDLIFVDGNHEPDPTWQYTEEAMRRGARPLVLLQDDIAGWSPAMDEMWAAMRSDPRFDHAGQLGDLGVLAVGHPTGLQPRPADRIAALTRVLARR